MSPPGKSNLHTVDTTSEMNYSRERADVLTEGKSMREKAKGTLK